MPGEASAKRPSAAPSALKTPLKRPGAARKTLASALKTKPLFNLTFALEMTRSAVQCRHGVKAADAGGVIAPRFLFKNHGGRKGAIKAAEKWVADFRKTHKCKDA